MKKIELTDLLRVVLIILIWLLTLTVVTATGTITNGGVGLIGTFAFYIGALYLAFGYFKDEKLMKNAKLSLVIVVLLVVIYLGVQCYEEILYAFNIDELNNAGNRAVAWKIYDVIMGIYNIGNNVIIGICLLVAVINALHTGDNKIIDIDEKDKDDDDDKEKKE